MGQVRAVLTGLSANANLQLILDADGDRVIDPGESVALSNLAGTKADSILAMLGESNYYPRVIGGETATRYTLDLQGYYAPTPEGETASPTPPSQATTPGATSWTP